MKRSTEVSYNPQLGYLKTIFNHDFDYLVGINDYSVLNDGVEFEIDTYKKDKATVVLNFVSDTAIRFRLYPSCNKNCFCNEVFNFNGNKNFKVDEDLQFIYMKTDRVEVKVRKRPWEVSYYFDGKLVTKEQISDSNVDNMCKYLPIGFEYDENKKVKKVHETMYMYSDEAFYGFGEKFTEFNKRGQKIHCWQTDALSTNTESSYKNHPFFMSSRGYAVLLNSFTKSTFDMGNTSNVSYGMEVEDAYLDYVMLFNKDYKSILKDYIGLTGEIPMIPKWAFGLWMSKCVYKTQDEVYSVVKAAKENNVRIDVINLDAWQSREDNGAWVWDTERFPNPQEMIDFLKENGIQLCLWIFPYIGERSKYFSYAAEKGYLVKSKDGSPIKFYSTATSTYKVGCFDFTNPEFIEWYTPRVKKVLSMGVGAVKTDFSEVVPKETEYFDGSNGIQGHNKLTFAYAKTIYSIMKQVKEEIGERPMLWGRSGYAGSHTIPAAWAGDSSTHLNNHGCILQGGLSISFSGVPFWGFDMGGFYNTDHEGYECLPSDVEYIRSVQFGFLSPLSRCHGKTPREPWNFSEEVQEIFQKYNTLRHKMTPYLYSMAYKAHYESIPMLRPLIMEYPDDRNLRNIGHQYLLGESILVAPIFDQDDFSLYLPKGEWTDLYTGEVYSGEKWIQPKISIKDIPLYLKENSMIPMLSDDKDYNPYENYKNLTVYMSISNKVSETYYDDDFKGNMEASLQDNVLVVNTNMDVTKLIVFSQKEIIKTNFNGKEITVKKLSDYQYETIV